MRGTILTLMFLPNESFLTDEIARVTYWLRQASGGPISSYGPILGKT